MAVRLITLARRGAFPRLLPDGRLVVGYARGAGTPEMRAEVAEYLRTYHGGIVAELVAWAVSGTPPAPVCDDGAVPTQGPLGIMPAALLEGSEAALARLDHATQGALALAVLRGAGCEASIEGGEVVLRGPTTDVHTFVAEHATALGRALLRASAKMRNDDLQVANASASDSAPPYAPE